MLKILSLGAGVQSSTVLLMSCVGVLPKLDAAIFADTGWEPQAVYDYMANVLQPEAARAGIPLYCVSKGNIREDALRYQTLGKNKGDGRWASMPLFVFQENGERGQIRRQCTSEYKIIPIEKKLKELTVEHYATEKLPTAGIQRWIGISGDEMRRLRQSQTRWIENYYPLVFAFDRPWHRHDCEGWLQEHGYPQAPRSACLGCPYHSDDEWRQISMRQNEWDDVTGFDVAMRKPADMRGTVYLHSSGKPLSEVDLENQEDKGQTNWLNECEGMCGV